MPSDATPTPDGIYVGIATETRFGRSGGRSRSADGTAVRPIAAPQPVSSRTGRTCRTTPLDRRSRRRPSSRPSRRRLPRRRHPPARATGSERSGRAPGRDALEADRRLRHPRGVDGVRLGRRDARALELALVGAERRARRVRRPREVGGVRPPGLFATTTTSATAPRRRGEELYGARVAVPSAVPVDIRATGRVSGGRPGLRTPVYASRASSR